MRMLNKCGKEQIKQIKGTPVGEEGGENKKKRVQRMKGRKVD